MLPDRTRPPCGKAPSPLVGPEPEPDVKLCRVVKVCAAARPAGSKLSAAIRAGRAKEAVVIWPMILGTFAITPDSAKSKGETYRRKGRIFEGDTNFTNYHGLNSCNSCNSCLKISAVRFRCVSRLAHHQVMRSSGRKRTKKVWEAGDRR